MTPSPATPPANALVRAAVRSGATRIAGAILRAERAERAEHTEGERPCVGVLVLPSGAMPDGIVYADSPGGCHVGAVSHARAVELVSSRAQGAVQALDHVPVVGNRWCVVLGASSLVLVPMTVPGQR